MRITKIQTDMKSIKLNKEFKMQRTTRSGNDIIIKAKVIRETEKAVLIEWVQRTQDNFIAEYKGVSLNCKKTYSDTIFNSWIPKSLFTNMENWEKRDVKYALDFHGNISYKDDECTIPYILEEGGNVFIFPFWIECKQIEKVKY